MRIKGHKQPNTLTPLCPFAVHLKEGSHGRPNVQTVGWMQTVEVIDHDYEFSPRDKSPV